MDVPWPHGYERPTVASEPPSVLLRPSGGDAGHGAGGKPHAVVHCKESAARTHGRARPDLFEFLSAQALRTAPRCGVLRHTRPIY